MKFHDGRGDKGVTSVEYALIVTAIAIAIIVIVFLLGDSVAALFGKMHFTK